MLKVSIRAFDLNLEIIETIIICNGKLQFIALSKGPVIQLTVY